MTKPKLYPASASEPEVFSGLGKDALMPLNNWDHIPVAIYTCDQNGYITSYNEAAATLWGFNPVPGKDLWFELWKIFNVDGSPVLPEDCPIARTLKGEAAIGGEEFLVKCRDGGWKNVRSYPVPAYNHAGMLTGAVNTLIDMTWQRTEEGKQAMLAAIIESSEDAIISKTLDGTITSWNNGAMHIFGYTEEEAIGQPISILIPKELISEEYSIIENIRRGNKVSHYQTIRQAKDGHRIPISLTVSPVKNSDGRIIGASKVARDITGQKRAEEEILQNSRRLEILNSIGKVISEKMDVEGILRKVTDATTKVTGAEFGAFFYNKENSEDEVFTLFALSGMSEASFEGIEMPGYITIFQPAFTGKRIVRIDDFSKDPRYDKNKPNGGMPQGNLPEKSYLAVPVVSVSGVVIGGLLLGHPEACRFKAEHEDLVASIASQASIALDNSKLFEEVRSLSSKKDEFIALASHELKTPLTSITGYLQLLARYQKEGEGKVFIDKCVVQMRKLNALVGNLLDISKIQSGKLSLSKETFVFKQLLLEVISSIELSSDSHEIILEDDLQELYVEADKQRMEQVLVNLLSNAIKYSPDGKRVIVTLRSSETEIAVHIKDYGIGITALQQEHIFSQFYRADGLAASIGGLGLGLHISKEIVEQHQGKIWVESEYGVGTTFNFTLPLTLRICKFKTVICIDQRT